LARPIRRLLAGVFFFVATCVVGVLGYRIAGWDTIDAIYMVVITIFGVGYGEVRPVDTPELRAFTSGVIVAGYGAALIAVGGFVQLITEGEINRALGARRMNRGIRELRDHTILCGYGRVGRILARDLVEHGARLVVVDRDPKKIVEAENDGHLVLLGEASDESILEQAGVRHAGQRRRSRRWLQTARMPLRQRRLGNPNCSSRRRAVTTSAACKEEKTRWPESAACKTASAVSGSRISLTSRTSGSCRTMPRRAAASVIPLCGSSWL